MLRCALKAVAATAREIWLTYGCCARTGRVLCRMWCQCLARQWKGTPRAARSEADARPAGPGRASSRRAERSSRRGRRAGGQASRRSQIWGYRTFRVAGVSPRCCGRGWCGGVRSSRLRRPSRGWCRWLGGFGWRGTRHFRGLRRWAWSPGLLLLVAGGESGCSTTRTRLSCVGSGACRGGRRSGGAVAGRRSGGATVNTGKQRGSGARIRKTGDL